MKKIELTDEEHELIRDLLDENAESIRVNNGDENLIACYKDTMLKFGLDKFDVDIIDSWRMFMTFNPSMSTKFSEMLDHINEDFGAAEGELFPEDFLFADEAGYLVARRNGHNEVYIWDEANDRWSWKHEWPEPVFNGKIRPLFALLRDVEF